MTTLMMPSDYGVEMFLGSSPVLTSGYLASQPFLHDYPRLTPLQAAPLQTTPVQSTPLHNIWGGSSQSCGTTLTTSSFRSNCDSQLFSSSPLSSSSIPLSSSSFSSSTSCYSNNFIPRSSFRSSGRRSPQKKKVETLPFLPIKSCLVARQEEEVEEGAISPTRLKKKVVFADTRGHPLTEVRVLTERPDCPPRWSADFLEQVTRGAKAEAVCDQWELAFPQPASDYLGMKARLENDYISLENVVIKESENRVAGTVKVRNLSFHKSVKVRYTINNWTTHEDVEGEFVPSLSTATGASYDLYDTFSFSLPLPGSTQADKLEFCVCFKSEIGEYWDNNNNKNYVIVSFRPKTAAAQELKPKDVFDVNLDSWTEFASWNHLDINGSPYW
ncbi:protein phosphatase 1 regulatory subunit 3C-B-like [Homarus americanus]|uniref:protein phosphatase 1 regulatory subunit 3C-B-like n=1 Tax=Homarus americanus TaxID=6706 RepID=UPI001C494C5C|nr:protein phosphatase 1 regulatory subunit 3C-B-like [Homarus americanus]XP_042218494.1 protein phosphatase 1 regulatory subunit 3C-B-like [Homarus americanus]